MNLGPGTVSRSPSYSDLNSTFNTLLPSNWLSGNVTFVATVDSDLVVPETDEGNNTLSITRNFNSVPDLDVKIIPIEYWHDEGFYYTVYPAPTNDTISDKLQDVYPVAGVDIGFHPSVGIMGDLTSPYAWESLLNYLTNLKQLEGAPDSQVYYGLVPVDHPDGGTWFSPYGGISGIGWIGWRVSVGVDDSAIVGFAAGDTAIHEIGHNLDLEHAPCGNPSNPDPSYPYPNADIGQYGFDIPGFNVVSPTYKDMMSYCGPYWISDYNYIKLYNDQRAYGDLQPLLVQEQGLLVRLDLSSPDAEIQPTYKIDAPFTILPVESDVSAEYVDSSGKVIARFPMPVFESVDAGTHRYTSAILPALESPISKIRMISSDLVVDEKEIQSQMQLPDSSSASLVQIEENDTETVLKWSPTDIPVMVRFSEDGGVTWQVLALDWIGGELPLQSTNFNPGTITFEITFADNLIPPLFQTWSVP